MVNTHVLLQMKPKSKDFNEGAALEQCYHWIVTEFAPMKCMRAAGKGHRQTKCGCMNFLQEVENADDTMKVAQYIVLWSTFSAETRRNLLHEWAQVSCLLKRMDPSSNLNYMIPGIPVREEEESRTICQNGLQGLLNVGRRAWNTAIKSGGKTDPRKGRTGVQSSRGKHNLEVYESLHNFFLELKNEALPFATRIIREKTRTTTRDDDPDSLVLAPHVSKHSIYARWCYSRGWKVSMKCSARTVYNPLKDYQMREYDDNSDGLALWPAGTEYMRVVSWSCFLKYWTSKFSMLKVRKKGADTCTDCQVLCNEFRMRETRTKRMEQRMEEANAAGNNGTDTESSDGDESECSDSVGEDDLETEIERLEGTLQKARDHVRAYQIQRDESRRLISLARNDITYLLPSLLRRKVLTIDMGQNLCLPNFEAEQPGDKYYMSPLTVLLFGVVNNATEDQRDRMNAYIWREFEGDRGANNIASCLLMDLKRRGWLNGPNFSELTYIADNCAGQNKNKVVVRFLMYLVENKIFPRVRILFLVKGHTKNSADRMFNLLKHQYHRRDIFTYEELHNILNANQYVDVFQMKPNHFHNHLKWQDTLYRTPAAGEFKKTHVFTICSPTHSIHNARPGNIQALPTELLKQDDNASIIRVDSLLPTTRNTKAKKLDPNERARKIANMEQDLVQLQPTPLKDIKQVELWKKWGPLLPKHAREITCPKPPESVINSIKERNREKSKKRTKQKRLQDATEKSDSTTKKTGNNAN